MTQASIDLRLSANYIIRMHKKEYIYYSSPLGKQEARTAMMNLSSEKEWCKVFNKPLADYEKSSSICGSQPTKEEWQLA